ncbi:hypothetical protein HK105_204606 [Polyrhizophydium stewartii]|uniref:STPR domain-containing protein n=1 Tax=Polyrhizophydium stewartii TaxID=2732419 RepID=A0ABR4N8Q0_9FUNG|nr:hypothetical protein HK105_002126 [Polyrhizophydium stewartii]
MPKRPRATPVKEEPTVKLEDEPMRAQATASSCAPAAEVKLDVASFERFVVDDSAVDGNEMALRRQAQPADPGSTPVLTLDQLDVLLSLRSQHRGAAAQHTEPFESAVAPESADARARLAQPASSETTAAARPARVAVKDELAGADVVKIEVVAEADGEHDGQQITSGWEGESDGGHPDEDNDSEYRESGDDVSEDDDSDDDEGDGDVDGDLSGASSTMPRKSRSAAPSRKRRFDPESVAADPAKALALQRKREYLRDYMRRMYANETPEQRRIRLDKNQECKRRRIAKETPEEREDRLRKVREYGRKRNQMLKLRKTK